MFLFYKNIRKFKGCLTCLSIIILVICSNSALEAIVFDEVSTLHVWITISSLANKDPNKVKALLFRQVELNWINAPLEDENDYIGLYLDSQPDDKTLPVSVHRLNGQSSGQIITDYYLPLIDFNNGTVISIERNKNFRQPHPELFDGKLRSSQLETINDGNGSDNNNKESQSNNRLRRLDEGSGGAWSSNSYNQQSLQLQTNSIGLSDECVGYCLAYHSRNKILARNCLKTNPNWMRDSFQLIGTRPLPSLMIPGTHNSATYPKHLDKTVLHMINKYQMNQDESIFNQLVYGVRHLDLRVGYIKVKQRPERLWIYHDIFRTEVSVNEVFDQVRKFLELTSHEIIIIDFHRFTVGFQNENTVTQRERHSKLIELIFEQLGKYIVPSYLGQHAPLNEYVAIGKRLIVGYANRASIIPASHTEHLQSMFGHLHYSNDQMHPGKQQVRDIDAIKQDQDEATSISGFDGTDLQSRSEDEEQLEKGSVGSRLFNKIKSLKLISKSFSKRSIESSKPSRPSLLSATSSLEFTASSGNSDSENGAAFDDGLSVARAALFFPPVRHLWPNKDSIDGLARYMNETTCRKYFGELSSMMVELTPTVFGAIADKYDGNRKLAQQINRPVTDWIRDRWLHCINIVASDFFLGNDLIRLSIYANKMRVLHVNVDLNLYGQCKSFKRVEHLLDKSKIPIQFAYHHRNRQQTHHQHSIPDDNDIIRHTSSDGDQILLKPLTSSFNRQAFIPREKRDSFVENISDGLSNFLSSFKRLLNL